MSTFNGVINEFTDIRVDYFRSSTEFWPPLACFLSHVHSDHLSGLESLRSPFVYCSAATREILLRLERFPCRINYAKGILEARVQTYIHLRKLLKPLPLETPTVMELAPGKHIQVTLFDANHCPGAVMFLFEGDGKAVLYTGDIRSEPWFVNALARSPSLAEYTSGLKTLDTIYLDTSFTENVGFQTKIQGIQELLRKVSLYPDDTIFHLQAWTFGYEDVWIALSKALKSKIHVDNYKLGIYKSLVQQERLLPMSVNREFARQYPLSPEAAGLVGFKCANTHHPGCLTQDFTVRLHSCEKGNYCSTIQDSPVVWIQPVVAHLPNGQSVEELGVGGGGGDLEKDAELDCVDPADIEALLQLSNLSIELQDAIRSMLMDSWQLGRKVPLDLDKSSFGNNNEVGLKSVFQAMAKKSQPPVGTMDPKFQINTEELPNKITFPFSRHSSYPELCDLVNMFNPRDIQPCTVDERRWRSEGLSIEGLFGDYCSGGDFLFDLNFCRPKESQAPAEVSEDTQATASSTDASVRDTLTISSPVLGETTLEIPDVMDEGTDAVVGSGKPDLQRDSHGLIPDPATVYIQDSQDSEMSQQAMDTRLQAFRAVLGNATWNAGHELGLLSTRDHHTELEQDLGESQPKY